jgi:polysaccharide export outer membrane protein
MVVLRVPSSAIVVVPEKRKIAVGLTLVVAFWAYAPLLAGQSGESAPSIPMSPKPETSADYVIGAGDILQVFVWKEPDVSREVRVRTDGKVTIPLLGDVVAAGSAPEALAADLSQRLGRFLTSPKVTVSLMASSSLRFFVVGEVNKPGEFLLSGRVTVLEALALAGGFKDEARRDKIVIIRRDLPLPASGAASSPAVRRPDETVIRVNYKSLASGTDLRGNALLQPGDTIVVP